MISRGWIVLGVALATTILLASTHYAAFNAGKDAESAKRDKADIAAERLGEKVSEAIAAGARTIAADVNKTIGSIKITNTTVNRQIEREKEIHHVLSDPNCAVPVSTVKLRNAARIDPDPNRRAGQRPDDGVPKPAAPERSGPAAAGR